MLRKLIAWVLRNIAVVAITLVILSMIASFSYFEILGDMYDYSDEETQTQFVEGVVEPCQDIWEIPPEQLDLLLSMDNLELEGFDPEKVQSLVDLCTQYKNGELDDRQLFLDLIGTLPDEMVTGPLEESKFINYNEGKITFNVPKVMFIIIALICLGIITAMYFGSPKVLLTQAGMILTNIGFFFVIPFILVKIYIASVGIDTSLLLQNLLGNSGLDNIGSTLVPLAMLLLKQIFTLTLFVVGVVLLIGGFVLRILFKKK